MAQDQQAEERDITTIRDMVKRLYQEVDAIRAKNNAFAEMITKPENRLTTHEVLRAASGQGRVSAG